MVESVTEYLDKQVQKAQKAGKCCLICLHRNCPMMGAWTDMMQSPKALIGFYCSEFKGKK